MVLFVPFVSFRLMKLLLTLEKSPSFYTELVLCKIHGFCWRFRSFSVLSWFEKIQVFICISYLCICWHFFCFETLSFETKTLQQYFCREQSLVKKTKVSYVNESYFNFKCECTFDFIVSIATDKYSYQSRKKCWYNCKSCFVHFIVACFLSCIYRFSS